MASVSVNPPAVDTAKRWLERDRVECATRDMQIQMLNNAYDGRLNDLSGDTGATVMTRTLKDSTAGADQGSNPRFSEVPVPMVRSITDDWVSVMAVTPNHICPPNSPGEDASEREADKREKIVAGIYYDSSLNTRIQEGAHYRSLHGAELLHSLPSNADHRVRIDTRSSYRTYARLLSARRDLMYMAWDWDEITEYILEMWPEVEKVLDESHGFIRKGQGKVTRPQTLRMTEWYDRQNRIVMVCDKWVDGMPWAVHKWGFVPGQVVPNISGVGLWSQPDVLHAVHLSQLYSELLSMMQDGLSQTIYDTPIIFDDQKVGNVQIGPHEALQLSQKARTGSLHSAVKMPEGNLLLDILERITRLSSGWPKTQSSEMDSPIISGRAFVAAQGPMGQRAALKHMLMADALERVTAFALRLYEHHFPQETITLMTIPSGTRTSVIADRGAMGGPFSFVPKRDIAGNYQVIVNFPPGGADQYRATIEQLQLVEAGIISIETMRQIRPGIDPKAESMRIERESREKMTRNVEEATAMGQAQMGLQQQMQMSLALAGGGAPGAPQGGPPQQGPPQQAAPQQAAPAEGAAPGAMGPLGAAEAPAKKQAVAGALETQGAWERVTREEVRVELGAVTPIKGRIFIMGAVATMGWTTAIIEIGLTDMLDKATLTQKTKYGRQGRLLITEVPPDTVPGKGMVEVTPTTR